MGGQAHLVGPVVDELPHLVVDAVGVVVVEVVGLHRHADVHLPVGHPEQLLHVLPERAVMGMTGTPSSRESFSTSMRSPCFSTSSMKLRATTMGAPAPGAGR